MQMDHDEYIALQEQLQDHFDGRYRKLIDCNDISENIEKRVSRDNVRLAVIEQQQRINNWLTLAIAGGIIALVIKVFLGG